jgi:hypothetical protein
MALWRWSRRPASVRGDLVPQKESAAAAQNSRRSHPGRLLESRMLLAYDLFISYRSGDLPLAEGLYDRLTRAGLRVWFDKARLRPGCDWHREIEAGCEASRIILPVLTPRWRESEWCRYETYGGEYVMPLL